MNQRDRPPTEIKPWGAFHVLDEGPGYMVKRIAVSPGGRLSLQSHKRRADHWTIILGEPTVTVGETVRILGRGEPIDIPTGAIHRLENLGATSVEVVEVQFGDYLGEDDMVRHQDIYDRV